MAPKKSQKGQTSKSEAVALFEAYQTAEGKLEAAEKAKDAAFEARTATVKAIYDKLGAGPFEWNGKTVKIFKRDSKDENDQVIGTSWFFRSIGEEVQKIG